MTKQILTLIAGGLFASAPLFVSDAKADQLLILVTAPDGKGVASTLELFSSNNWGDLADTDQNGRKSLPYDCKVGEKLRALPHERGTFTYSQEALCAPGTKKVALSVQLIDQAFLNQLNAVLANKDLLKNLGPLGSNFEYAVRKKDYALIAQTSRAIVEFKYDGGPSAFDLDRFQEISVKATAAAIGFDPASSLKSSDGKLMQTEKFDQAWTGYQKSVGIPSNRTIYGSSFEKITGVRTNDLVKTPFQ
jgi:hypothetical protein